LHGRVFGSDVQVISMQGCVGGPHVNLMEKLGDRSSGLGIAQSISPWVGHPLLG